MRSTLLNGTAYGRIMPLFAPPNEGGGGGGDGEGGDDDDSITDEQLGFSDDNDDTGPLLENHEYNGETEEDEDDEINVDGSTLLAKLFEDEDDDNSGNNADDEAGDSAEAQAAIAKALKDGIAGFGVPEDAIPEDFDPTDRKQLRDLLGSVHRSSMQETIRLMWAPVSAALNQTVVRLRQEMSESVTNGQQSHDLNSMLTEAIPAYKTPAMKQVIDVVKKQSMKKFPGDNRRIVAATKRAVEAMGINTTNRTRNSKISAAQRTNSVLDAFAKLPTPRPSAQPNNRLRQNLKNK